MNGKAPAIFIGHGSPMNAIEDNPYTQTWSRLGKELPVPEAILVISAHWFTNGSYLSADPYPKMIYDMYGFPDELYQVNYPAKGAPELAFLTKSLISRDVRIDDTRGLDHGAWSVLCKMYPEANIPVYQLSIDAGADTLTHYQIGREISSLRNQGVMILGSGNVVHNLSVLDWNMSGGYNWAEDFDKYIKDRILAREYHQVVSPDSAGTVLRDSVTTPDHFFPLLYVLGAARENDTVTVFQ